MSEYYSRDHGKAYLAQRLQSTSARVQALRSEFFADLGGSNCHIVDFGCGTGGILSNLTAEYKAGVEVSEAAARLARDSGIHLFSECEALPSKAFDVAISFHALEHVDEPLEALRKLARLVKSNGHIRLVVPCETPLSKAHRQWHENTYQHLYTWTPLTFGNLAQRAGYRNIETHLAPMPTCSRLVRFLSPIATLQRTAHMALSIRKGRLNVVLNAQPPAE